MRLHETETNCYMAAFIPEEKMTRITLQNSF